MALPELDDDPAEEGQPDRGGPSRALTAAWMLLAIVLGLAAGYVLMAAPDGGGGGERTLLTVRIPPRADSADSGETSSGETSPAAGEREATQTTALQRHGPPLTPLRDTHVDPPLAPSIGMLAGDTGPAGGGTDGGPAAAGPSRPAPQTPAVSFRAPAAGREPDDAAPSETTGERDTTTSAGGEATPAGDNLDRIAVVVRGLGLEADVTKAAIEKLPAGVTLSFSPYAAQVVPWMQAARKDGHELLLDVPFQPRGFPVPDPGDRTLLTDDPPDRNLERLTTILDRGVNPGGIVARYGGAFLTERDAVAPVLRELGRRGLMVVDNGRVPGTLIPKLAPEFGVRHVRADAVLDRRPVGRSVAEAWLAAATRTAQESGLALVLVDAYPMTVDLLASWTDALDRRGLTLIPVSKAATDGDTPQAAKLR